MITHSLAGANKKGGAEIWNFGSALSVRVEQALSYRALTMALLTFSGFLKVLPLSASRLACSSQSC